MKIFYEFESLTILEDKLISNVIIWLIMLI